MWGYLRRRLNLKLVKTVDLEEGSYIFGMPSCLMASGITSAQECIHTACCPSVP